jgi:hypothetical protein
MRYSTKNINFDHAAQTERDKHMRFTDEQLNFYQAMKGLIELYYKMDDIREEKPPSSDSKYKEMESVNLQRAQNRLAEDFIVEKIGKILSYVIPNFYPAIYDEYRFSPANFRYGIKDSYISVSKYHILWLCRVMDALHTDCMMGTIQKAYELKKAIRTEDILASRLDEAIKITPNKLKKSAVRKKRPSIDKDLYIIRHNDKELFRRHIDKLDADLNVSMSKSYYETFYVSFDFECNLVLPLSKLGAHSLVDQDEEITAPRSGQTTDFWDVVRYIFAKYYCLFGSFDRIKICNYNPCKKLFIEKKDGSSKHCSDKCRHNNHYALLSDDQRNCMLRQNAWIGRLYVKRDKNLIDKKVEKLFNQLPHTPHLMDRDYCSMCREQLGNGKCPEFKKRNKKAFNIFSQIRINNQPAMKNS